MIVRYINVEIDKNSWGRNVPSPNIAKINNQKFEFLFIDLMEGIALATKYPYLKGKSLNDQCAWMRYKTCFIANSDLLQLTRDYEMVDPHQKNDFK